MREAWHYFRLDVLLDIGPRLAILWRGGGQEFLKVAWLDIGNYSAVFDGIIVIYNYTGQLSTSAGGQLALTFINS